MSDVAPPPNEFGLAGVGRDARFLIPPVESPPTPPTGEIWDLGGAALGGGWRAQVVVPPGSDPQALRSACQQAFDAVGAVLDHWTPTSEVARFNAAPAGSWSLSKPFWEDLNLALNLADETDGAFDPTLGALVDLWGFGPAGRRDVLSPTPGDAEIEAALEAAGWTRLRLNRKARAAMQPGGMKLDLTALMRGLAVDRASAALTAMGCTSHFIDMEGDVKGRGVRPDGRPWLAVLPPMPGPRLPTTVIAAHDVGAATASVFKKGFRHGARIVSHLIEGRGGRSVDTELVSVTVVHREAARADALSTALLVMGPYAGMDWAERIGVAALFVEDTPRGRRERLSPVAKLMAGQTPA